MLASSEQSDEYVGEAGVFLNHSITMANCKLQQYWPDKKNGDTDIR